MSEPFIGEIAVFPYYFVPKGWLSCDGQEVSADTYPQLFNIIGSIFCSDGDTGFRLPNLNGRVPIGAGEGKGLTNRPVGETGGENAVTLSVAQLPPHRHLLTGATVEGDQMDGANNILGCGSSRKPLFSNPTQPLFTEMNKESLTSTGGGESHENRQPYLCLKFCIAYDGYYPRPTHSEIK